MIYEDIKEAYVGTATVFYDNPNSGRVYAVTCAHNLVHYDPTEDTVHSLKYCWFDRRITKNRQVYCVSESRHKYRIDEHWIHPNYDPKEQVSPYDLAIVSFIDDDIFFKDSSSVQNKSMNQSKSFRNYKSSWEDRAAHNNESALKGMELDKPLEERSVASRILSTSVAPVITAVFGLTIGLGAVTGGVAVEPLSMISGAFPASVGFEGIALFGFPQKKRGELWGEQMDIAPNMFTDFKDGKMIKYRIHTTGGQSGSAIIKSTEKGTKWKILGIHTGGKAADSNWGIKMTQSNVQWIQDNVQEIEQAADPSKLTVMFL